MKQISIKFGMTLGLLAMPTYALAAGFLINEHGVASSGRANAFVAKADDGSAIFHNPAGISQLKGTQAYIGSNLILPSSQYTSASDGQVTETVPGTFIVPHLYLTHQINDKVNVGLGLNSPFGLSIRWRADSPGSQLIRRQVLRTTFISPVVSYDLEEFVPGLRIAAGPDLVPASVFLRRDLKFGDSTGNVKLGGTGFGVGGRVGLLYRPPSIKGLSFGATYRSFVDLTFEGEADFTVDPEFRGLVPPDGDVSTEIRLPQSVLAGVAYEFDFGLELEVDLNFIGWSSYERLVVDLPDGSQLVSPKEYRNTLVVRVGAAYAWEDWIFRAGYTYDPTPIPARTLDFTLPDGDRNLVSVGFGYKVNDMVQIDAFGLRILPSAQDTGTRNPARPPFKGEYEVQAWLGGISVKVATDI